MVVRCVRSLTQMHALPKQEMKEEAEKDGDHKSGDVTDQIWCDEVRKVAALSARAAKVAAL